MSEVTEYGNPPASNQLAQTRISALMAAYGDLVLELDYQATVLQIWNDRSKLLVHPSSYYTGKSITECFPGQAGEKLKLLSGQALGSGQTLDWELPSWAPQEGRWYRARVSPWDKKPDILGRVFIFLSDITAKIQEDTKIKLQEERYSLTVKGINAGIWDWNIRDNTEWWSAKLYELLGYENQEIPSGYESFVNFLLHPDDREALLAMGREHRKNFTPYQMDIRLRHKSGAYRWFETFGESLRDKNGQAIRMIGTIVDIHAKKQALLTLKESEERFTQIFNYAPIGIALLSPEGHWLKVNKMLCDMLGYQPEELLGVNNQTITHPDDLEKNTLLTGKLLKGQIEFCEFEKRYIHRDGHSIWVLLRATLIRDEEGAPLYGISQTLDISRRREHEAEKERTISTLNRQNDQLNNFAHIVSHNLRSHSANLQMLNTMYEDATSEEEREEFFSKIKNIGESLSRTIEDLTQIVKISKEDNLKMETVFFAPVLQRVKDSLEAEILKSKAFIEGDFSECPSIEYPAAYLDSILLNLLTNALKYRRENCPPLIKLKSVRVNGSMGLICSDNGIGINLDKHRKNIFGLYKTFHRHPQARGIGLFLIKNQIESLGGKISVSSVPDQGTEFEIIF